VPRRDTSAAAAAAERTKRTANGRCAVDARPSLIRPPAAMSGLRSVATHVAALSLYILELRLCTFSCSNSDLVYSGGSDQVYMVVVLSGLNRRSILFIMHCRTVFIVCMHKIVKLFRTVMTLRAHTLTQTTCLICFIGLKDEYNQPLARPPL
jgi:hypothetical protein